VDFYCRLFTLRLGIKQSHGSEALRYDDVRRLQKSAEKIIKILDEIRNFNMEKLDKKQARAIEKHYT